MAHLGTVAWFNDAKGFGFLTFAGGDIFCHYSAIQSEKYKSLDQGEAVEFDIETGPAGKQQAAKI